LPTNPIRLHALHQSLVQGVFGMGLQQAHSFSATLRHLDDDSCAHVLPQQGIIARAEVADVKHITLLV
jgi:hypothetical protein